MTKPKLLIDIPGHIDNDEELAEWVRDNPDLFSDAMDLDASQIDDRATVHRVTITDVEVDAKNVTIDYEYEFSAYYGCRDMNYAGTSDGDTIVGVRHANTMEFDKFTPPERRSTDEEF
jgi:hypothetical protein